MCYFCLGVFQGAIQGPEEFVEGMALGVKALVGGAVGKHRINQRAFSHMKVRIKVPVFDTLFKFDTVCSVLGYIV